MTELLSTGVGVILGSLVTFLITSWTLRRERAHAVAQMRLQAYTNAYTALERIDSELVLEGGPETSYLLWATARHKLVDEVMQPAYFVASETTRRLMRNLEFKMIRQELQCLTDGEPNPPGDAVTTDIGELIETMRKDLALTDPPTTTARIASFLRRLRKLVRGSSATLP